MTRRARPHLPLWLFTSSLVATIALAPTPAALAGWSAQGSGHGAGAAAVMPTGTAPTGRAAGVTVTISWSAAAFQNGTAVAGYVVGRYNASTGATETVGAGCTGVVTTTACTEQSVPAGTWLYTDTPVQMVWTGGQSPQSAPVTVG